MKHTPIIPNRQIILIAPLEPHRQIMVLVHQLIEPLQQPRAFRWSKLVDVLDVMPDWKDALPTCDWVRADYGMDGFELGADVQGVAARLLVEGEVAAGGGVVEAGLGEGGGQGFEEFLVGSGDAVVDLVAGGPECVCGWISERKKDFRDTGLSRTTTSSWELSQSQRRVVCRHRLETDVRVLSHH